MNFTSPTSGRSSARRPCDFLRAPWPAGKLRAVICLGQDQGSGRRSRRRSNLTPDESAPASKSFEPICKNFVTWVEPTPSTELRKLSKPHKLSQPLWHSHSWLCCYRPDVPAVGGRNDKAALLPCNPRTRLTLAETSSGLKIGAEHVRSVQTYAAACGTDGYCTSGLGNFPSRVSHHSSRL
jgi:hypothetical protein